jgi:hypothetical protein
MINLVLNLVIYYQNPQWSEGPNNIFVTVKRARKGTYHGTVYYIQCFYESYSS